MTDKAEEQVQPQQPAADVKPGDVAELNIQDLNAMKVIIDIASSRGTFKPNEMKIVGQTYEKLTSFLDAVSKQAEASKTGA